MFADKLEYLALDEHSRLQCFEKVLKRLKVAEFFIFRKRKIEARELKKENQKEKVRNLMVIQVILKVLIIVQYRPK